MMAHARKKGHEEAFIADHKLSTDASKWAAEEKANKKLMAAAWS
jgi:hypothetical protein